MLVGLLSDTVVLYVLVQEEGRSLQVPLEISENQSVQLFVWSLHCRLRDWGHVKGTYLTLGNVDRVYTQVSSYFC
jgi:hypothetical protein